MRCGLPLWSIPRRDLPIVSATIVLAGGAGRHGPDRGGLAQLTASMMDEGTTSRSSYELALAAEGMGTGLSTSCGWDGAYVSLQCLTPHLAESLDLAVDVLRNPTFPESEWARVHAQSLAALRADRDNAEARAYRGLLRALYGPDHPYRVPSDGEEETVARLTRDDLLAFHARFHGPGRAACIVAGDVDPDAFAEALDDRLADWSGPTAPRAEPPIASRGDATRVILLDRPGAAQAAVRVGHVGLARLDPDYHESLILNHILGGQFTSRLNAKLREEKGFTYGVRSHFDCRRGAGPFSVSASVQTDRVAEALVDLRREVVAPAGRPPAHPGRARRRAACPDRRPGPALRDPFGARLALREPVRPRPPPRPPHPFRRSPRSREPRFPRPRRLPAPPPRGPGGRRGRRRLARPRTAPSPGMGRRGGRRGLTSNVLARTVGGRRRPSGVDRTVPPARSDRRP